MKQLNPTLMDSLWTWRERLDRATMVVSTLRPEETLLAAAEVARDLAQSDRTVVLTAPGASAPLYWHVPDGKELEGLQPDLVLLLVTERHNASARLLLATADRVVLITGGRSDEQAESLRVMQLLAQEPTPRHIDVVVVTDRWPAARETGDQLLRMADRRFGGRVSWRHLPTGRLRGPTRTREEGTMPLLRPVLLSEPELLAREWEENFRRAERMLLEAQETLLRQMGRGGEPMMPMPPPTKSEDRHARAL